METDPTRIENGDVSCDMRVSVKMNTGEDHCPHSSVNFEMIP